MNTDSKKTENKQCTIPSVGRSTFRFDVENWGLGTLLYAYCLYWITIVGLINLGVYLFS